MAKIKDLFGPYKPDQLTITRHRISTTQGEVSLAYMGEPLGRYGDDYKLGEDGAWRGYPDSYWHDAARLILERMYADRDVDREIYERTILERRIERLEEVLAAAKASPPLSFAPDHETAAQRLEELRYQVHCAERAGADSTIAAAEGFARQFWPDIVARVFMEV